MTIQTDDRPLYTVYSDEEQIASYVWQQDAEDRADTTLQCWPNRQVLVICEATEGVVYEARTTRAPTPTVQTQDVASQPPEIARLRRALDDCADTLAALDETFAWLEDRAAAADMLADAADARAEAERDDDEEYEIQYEDVPYPYGIGRGDAAAARADLAAEPPPPPPHSHAAMVAVCEQRRAAGLDICGRPKNAPSRPLPQYAARDAEDERRRQQAEEHAALAERIVRARSVRAA